MNIIQAREAALLGKTVISPNGTELTASYFDHSPWSSEYVFGKWAVKKEPVEFYSFVQESSSPFHQGAVFSEKLEPFMGKRVFVRVEEAP